MILGFAGVVSATVMTRQLAVLEPLVDGCGDEDFDRFMAGGTKAMLRSKGFESDRLKEAMTMGAVVTEFQRSLDDIRQRGMEAGQMRVLRQQAAHKFGRRTAEELARLLAQIHDGEEISRIAAAVVDCDAPDDFLARVRGG